jgi:transcriptional regulator with XRE-family HTH domain/Zn-dependent peptidase ImmA (M78 family)
MERVEFMNAAGKPWERQGYADVVGVEPAEDAVRVRFANGDEIEVDIAALGLGEKVEFAVDEEGGALVARTKAWEREIDWMVLRSISDPAFAEEIRRRDAEEARRVGTRLRVLRENRGIPQKVAAQMVGMSAPQLSKLERGETDMRLSTIRSLLRALDASLSDIAGPEAPEVSIKELSQRAKASGAPAEVVKRIAAQVSPVELAQVLARGFGWDMEALLKGVPETPDLDVQVAFKSRSETKARTSPLLRLARTISELSAACYEASPRKLPSDPAQIRQELNGPAGQLSLASLTEWAWSMGVIVIPMSGPGFSAAAWFVGQRPVIVIKAAQDLMAHWLFILVHEIGHIALGHVAPGRVGEEGVVEIDDPTKATADDEDDEEEAANRFALDLLIPDREPLFAEIRKRSGQSLQMQKNKFKWKAKDVAQEAKVSVPLLALAAAYALTDVAEPRDRWGSAVNLAKEEGAARLVVRSAFEQRIDLGQLSELDAALVRAVVLE